MSEPKQIAQRLDTHSMDEAASRKAVVIKTASRPLVPIVFFPGVMGTRLKLSSGTDDFLWDPDSKAGIFKHYLFGGLLNYKDGTDDDIRGAARRMSAPGQLISVLDGSHLDDEKTRIRGALIGKDSTDKQANTAFIGQEMERRQARGWSSLFYDSYIPLLQMLDCWGRGLPVKHAGADGKIKTHHNLQSLHPVWAFGYDWRRGADLIAEGGGPYASGEHFKAFLQKVFADAYAELPKWHWPGKKQVIVVTHSMGSLVARYISEVVGCGADMAGIVHLAQPTTGAPAATLRLMMGTQAEADASLGGDEDRIVRNIMGLSPYRYLSEVAQLVGPNTLLSSNDYSADPVKAVAGPGEPIDWIQWLDPKGAHNTFVSQAAVDTARGPSGLPKLHKHERLGWAAPRYWTRWETNGTSGYLPCTMSLDEKQSWRADAASIKTGMEPASQPGKVPGKTKFDEISEAYLGADAIITSLRLKHHPKTTAIHAASRQTITRLTLELVPHGVPYVDPKTLLPSPKVLPIFKLVWKFIQGPGDGTVPASSGKALGSVGATSGDAVSGGNSDHQSLGNNSAARLQLLDALENLARPFR